MPDLLKRFVNAIIGSKKIMIALAAWILILIRPYLVKINVEVTQDELVAMLSIAGLLIVGQGVADVGKGKAQFEASQAAKGQPTSSSSLHVEVAAANPSPALPLPPAPTEES